MIYIMTSFSLKIVAYLTMFVDHIGLLFFPDDDFLRIIGRISFPLFAFLIAEGFLKTRNQSYYLQRLLIFGCIAQVPYMWFQFTVGSEIMKLNILFTLAFGLALLMLLQRKLYLFFAAGFMLLMILDKIIHFDYGMYGIFLILFSYIFIQKRVLGLGLLVYTTILVSLSLENLAHSSLQIYALLSLIPIVIYNGEMGKRVSRWWFYAIYPVHFLILVGLYYIL